MRFCEANSLTRKAALAGAPNGRVCPALSDMDWIQMGVLQVLGEVLSWREFLRTRILGVVRYFDAASSDRRLRLVSEVNEAVASRMPEHGRSAFGACEHFAKFEVSAGGRHDLGADCFETQIERKKRPCGHGYSLNLRTRATTHLSVSDLEDGKKKAKHDMHALKRLGGQSPSQGAAKGVKVVSASSGKELLALTGKVWLRWIAYAAPRTGGLSKFLTNKMTIRPGLRAWTYKWRWPIKATLGQKKAWGKVEWAKNMRARFVWLARNLMDLPDAEGDTSIGRKPQAFHLRTSRMRYE